MKPIEPGCLVYVPKIIKSVVQVIELNTEYKDNECEACGRVGQFWVLDCNYAACQCALIRVDGGDPDALPQEMGKEVTA